MEMSRSTECKSGFHTLVERVEQLTAKVDNLGARR